MAKTPAAKAQAMDIETPDDHADEFEVYVVDMPRSTLARSRKTTAALDLQLCSGPRAVFVIGSGKNGKTVFCRYAAERLVNQMGQEIMLAAADPGPRSIKRFVADVAEPETNDQELTVRWLQRLISLPIRTPPQSFMVDMGGGDTSLPRLTERAPGFVKYLEDKNVVVIGLHFLSTRTDDLANLRGLETAGFQPKVTFLILNEGTQPDPTMPREQAFAAVLRSKIFKDAIARGCIPIWMPRMEPSAMAKIEAGSLQFTAARDGIMPDDRKVQPLDMWESAATAEFLSQMDIDMAPVLKAIAR